MVKYDILRQDTPDLSRPVGNGLKEAFPEGEDVEMRKKEGVGCWKALDILQNSLDFILQVTISY